MNFRNISYQENNLLIRVSRTCNFFVCRRASFKVTDDLGWRSTRGECGKLASVVKSIHRTYSSHWLQTFVKILPTSRRCGKDVTDEGSVVNLKLLDAVGIMLNLNLKLLLAYMMSSHSQSIFLCWFLHEFYLWSWADLLLQSHKLYICVHFTLKHTHTFKHPRCTSHTHCSKTVWHSQWPKAYLVHWLIGIYYFSVMW